MKLIKVFDMNNEILFLKQKAILYDVKYYFYINYNRTKDLLYFQDVFFPFLLTIDVLH